LGIIPDNDSSSGISLVEFYFDGTKVGEVNYPGIEVRGVDSELFEIWSVRVNVPSISTTETSLAVSEKVFSSNGGEESAQSRLIRIIENIPPQVHILS
jgi:hypothetical protein